MILEFGIKHLYKSWLWDDLDLFYGKVNKGCQCICIGKTGKMSFNGWKLAGNGQMIRRFLFMKNMAPGELSAPAPRLYTCIFP